VTKNKEKGWKIFKNKKDKKNSVKRANKGEYNKVKKE
jgi:hypothetical protein